MSISNKEYLQVAWAILLFFCIYFAYSVLHYYND